MTDREVRLLQEDKSSDTPQPKGTVLLLREKDAEFYVSHGYAEYTQPQPNDIAVGACAEKFCSNCQTPICKIVYKTESAAHQHTTNPKTTMSEPKLISIRFIRDSKDGKHKQGETATYPVKSLEHPKEFKEAEKYCYDEYCAEYIGYKLPEIPFDFSQVDLLINRLKEAGVINLRLFVKVGGKVSAETGELNAKAPFEKEFEKNLYTREEMTQPCTSHNCHACRPGEPHKQWGIIAKENIVFIDYDKPELYKVLSPLLPSTLEATSPSKKGHHGIFVICGQQVPNGVFVLNKGDKEGAGELRADDYIIVCVGTTIPTGKYIISKDVKIDNHLEQPDFIKIVNPFLSSEAGNAKITNEEIETGVEAGFRHPKAISLIYHLIAQQGLGEKLTLEAVELWDKKNKPPMDDLAYLKRAIRAAINCEAEAQANIDKTKTLEQHREILREGKQLRTVEKIEAAIPPTIEELLETNTTLKAIKDGDLKDYATVEDAFAWFIYTLYSKNFSVRDAREAIDGIHNEKWVNSTEFFKEKCFKKAQKIIDAEKAKNEPEGPDGEAKESQASILYRLLKEDSQEKIEFFTDQNRTTYAQVVYAYTQFTTKVALDKSQKEGAEDTHTLPPGAAPLNTALLNSGNADNCVNASTKEIMKLDGEQFLTYAAHRLFDAEKKILYTDAAKQVIRLLNYDAQQGKRYELSNRVAPDPSGDGSIWIDTADAQNRAYHITQEDWKLTADVPILFYRFDHQKPLAEAVHEGDPRKLLPFVNIGANKNSKLTKHRQLLLLVQTAANGIPEISHPINAMFGSPGTHKSSAQHCIRKIFDPSTAPLQHFPKDEQAAIQVLDHHYIPIFDNLPHMPQWFSDILCGAVTGLGQESRALYTNDGSFIRAFRRCVMINGLNLPATKGDLLNRTIPHPTEPNVERRTDQELENAFNKVLPEILGGFLDVIVKALKVRETVKVPKLFRLADFTQWGCALSVALGETVEDFIEAMEENLISQNTADIENNVVADAFLTYCIEKLSLLNPTEDKPLAAPPEKVFANVTSQAEDMKIATKSKRWPSAACYFTRKLNDSKAAIVASGWNYEVAMNKDAKREMSIWRIQEKPKEADKQEGAKASEAQKTIELPKEAPKHYCSEECENYRDTGCKKPNAMFADKVYLSLTAEIPQNPLCEGFKPNGGV